MLIFLDPPEPMAPERKPRNNVRDYLALAAVILAIIVSLAGVCLVIAEASTGVPQAGRVKIAAA
jgi:hypothetical protein